MPNLVKERRARALAMQRSRGTGPRATAQAAPFHRRARARAGFHTRIRAGFPRHAIAGDRPPRYGSGCPFHRRARACPSPCLDLVKERSSGSPNPERAPIAGDRPPRYGSGKIRRSCPTEKGGSETVVRVRLHPNGSGSGDPALQGRCGLTAKRMARDRPSPYAREDKM